MFEPTNKLRFVVRPHLIYVSEGVGKTTHRNILQQLWEEYTWASNRRIVICSEWRDVPVEEETK